MTDAELALARSQVKELRECDAKMTPGEWRSETHCGRDNCNSKTLINGNGMRGTIEPWDADGIAALRNSAPAVARSLELLIAERDALARRLADEERSHEDTIRHRDFCESWADKLASAIGDIDEIGEHSNLNNPWEQALEIVRRPAEFRILEKERDALAAKCSTQAARIAELEAALKDACERMTRARMILTDNNPRWDCNWGMLDASNLTPLLANTKGA